MNTNHYSLTPEDFLSREEIKQLMKTCRERSELDLMKGRRVWPIRYALVDLALYSGLRVSEIVALKIRDLYLSTGNSYIIVRHGKGNKERVVYIDDKLSKHLQWFLEYKRKHSSNLLTMMHPCFLVERNNTLHL